MGTAGLEEITIIIPVYNEADALDTVLPQTDALLLQERFRFHFILVNDGSTDNSGQILDSLEGRPGYTVITHHDNYGYGAALKTGLRHAKTEHVGIADADGTYPIDQIPALAEYMRDGYAMVVGDRSGQAMPGSIWRRLPKRALTHLANYLAGRKIPDLNSGLRIMKKDQADRFLPVLPDGFSFTSTITLAMLTSNLPVRYVPISYYPRIGKSKIRPIYDTLNFFQLIVRTAMYFRPLKVFASLSGLLIVAAFLSLWLSRRLTGQVMDVTFGILVLSAVIAMTVGLLADLIVKKTDRM